MVNNKVQDESEMQTQKPDEDDDNGVIQKRCCTDIICWGIFVVCIVFWIYAVSEGLANGKPNQLVAPWDEAGYQCGESDGYSGYNYAFFYTLINPVTYLADGSYYKKVMCVKSCPTYTTDPDVSSLSTFAELSIDCKDTTYTEAMTDSVIIPTYSSGTIYGCQYFQAYKSKAFLGKYCIPDLTWVNTAATSLATVASSLTDVFGGMGAVFEYVDDMQTVYPVFLIGFGVSVVIGLIYCYFLRCFAGIITWLIILFL